MEESTGFGGTVMVYTKVQAPGMLRPILCNGKGRKHERDHRDP